MKGAIRKMEDGAKVLDKNPCELAIAKLDKMKANFVKAIDDGVVEAGLRRVTLDDWRTAYLTVGIPRVSTGVDKAMPKRREFDEYLVNTLNQVLPKIAEMPDLTLEDSLQRVRALMEHMSRNPYKRR
jgi:hypothetical protein